MQSRRRRPIRIILASMVVALLTFLVAGFIYEALGRRQDRKRFLQIGRSVDIGGRSLNIYCSGEGSPAVILDTGGGSPGYSNFPLQSRIARFTRACWFDRAGLGWSDPSSVVQNSAAMADDLHALLHAAGIAPPYVRVGQSFSGFNVRVFTAKYPREVAGIVLVDSVHEDQRRYEPPAAKAPVLRLPAPVRTLLCTAVPWAARVGLIRFLLNRSGARRDVPPEFTPYEAATLHGLERQPKALVAQAGCHTWEQSAEQARAAGDFGDRPLIVLTAGYPIKVGDPHMDRELAAFDQIWIHQLQPQLARLSTRGRQVIVQGSGHGIAQEAPNEVVGAIREVVSTVKK